MGTRALTTVYDEDQTPLLSFYRQMDGYFEGHGEELKQFLFGFKVVNGYNPHSDLSKCANGMSCLAAGILCNFKQGIGGIYIVKPSNYQEYNYRVRLINNKLSLVGTGHGKKMVFKLE